MCMGSSPLTRGKPGAGLELDLRPRLIPAHAGKTSSPPSWEPGRAAHPRSRGENFLIVNVERKVGGSSPLTRGKLPHRERGAEGGRLIPAHAGKTLCRGWHCHGRGAHPRSRGENSPCTTSWLIRLGSSPLTRGKRHEVRGQGCAAGLIPAHAGKTPSTCPADRRSRAHPRSRGENAHPEPVDRAGVGSSPLTRGKPVDGGGHGGDAGLIPAHAGKTLSHS